MFGSSSNSPSPPKDTLQEEPDSGTTIPPTTSTEANTSPVDSTTPSPPASETIPIKERRGGSSPGNGRPSPDKDNTAGATAAAAEKKRRSSGVGNKASAFLASAKNSLHFSSSPNSSSFRVLAEQNMQTPLQKLGMKDPELSVPQGTHNNSAGESVPGPRSTFRVGVWEDRNKKCRRTMEDTHAFLYNFLHTPAPSVQKKQESPKVKAGNVKPDQSTDALLTQSASDLELSSTSSKSASDMMETDNGYFAIFDGHAGTFAADWCGKKLHIILEDMIRKHPNTPVPELLDQTFTSVDHQLGQLPLKNSGCTAVTAVLRWEDRIPNSSSATGSTAIAPATLAAVKAVEDSTAPPKEDAPVKGDADRVKELKETVNPAADIASCASSGMSTGEAAHARLKSQAMRQRVLYTANVGDARIVLCRNGRALRLSYDHKGSDENEGNRITSAGGLILNNRVNGVLAVTRALGDAYMKELVTGHPYTTETVIQPDLDEFIILACDGLWDVCSDQEAVDLVRDVQDPVVASKQLVDYALARFSTDNLSCMIVRLNKSALLDTASNPLTSIGVEGDPVGGPGRLSEADKIVADARRRVEEGAPSMGVSGSNSGKGHEQRRYGDEGAPGTAAAAMAAKKEGGMEKVVEEEAAAAGRVEVAAAAAREPDVNVGVPTTTSPEEEEDLRK
ncbi:mgpp2cl-1, protein phosphatase 2C-like protein 1 [Pseudogymnoascus australis]